MVGGDVVPNRFAGEHKRAIRFNQRAPANWNFRFAIELLRQHEKKEIRAAVADECFELGAIEEPVLHCAGLTQHLFVPAMIDRFQVVRVELGKQ